MIKKLRRRLTPRRLVALGVVLLVAAAGIVMVTTPEKGSGSDDLSSQGPSADDLTSRDQPGDDKPVDDDSKPAAGAFPGDPGGGDTFFGTQPGLGGQGYNRNTPSRAITLTVTSSRPIGTVGYIIPTSPDRGYGVAKNLGTSWSLTTRVYGKPGYARLFVQAGPSGAAVTCSVSVAGGPSDSRSTSGPYSQAMCQA